MTRRAAVAGVLAFFVAQPVRPDRVSSDIRPETTLETRAFLPPPRLTVPPPLCRPRPHRAASAETKRVRAKDAAELHSPLAGSMSKSAGSGSASTGSRAFLKDEQAAVMKAYVSSAFPASKRQKSHPLHALMRKRFFSSCSERASELVSVL